MVYEVTNAHVLTVRELQSLKIARGGPAQPFCRFLSIQCVTPVPIFASLRFTGHIGASLIWNTLYAKSLIQLSFQGDKVAGFRVSRCWQESMTQRMKFCYTREVFQRVINMGNLICFFDSTRSDMGLRKIEVIT
jgi:hypothetical protein